MSTFEDVRFSLTDASRTSGLSMDQLRTYDRVGYISPSVAQVRGRGTSRIYSYGDVLVLRTIGVFRDMGVEPINMLHVIKFLRDHEAAIIGANPTLLLATNYRQLHILTEDWSALHNRVVAGESLAIVPLGALVQQVRSEVRQSRPHGNQMLLQQAI